jgi:hypothetical protein
LANVHPAELRAGDVLVTHDRPRDDLLVVHTVHQRARRYLAAELGDDAPERAQRAQRDLKDALDRERATRGFDSLVYDLGWRLNDPGLARSILTNLPNDRYIAPQAERSYRHLRHVLRLPPDTHREQWRLLARWRVCCQRAGRDLVEEDEDRLAATGEWRGSTDEFVEALTGAWVLHQVLEAPTPAGPVRARDLGARRPLP